MRHYFGLTLLTVGALLATTPAFGQGFGNQFPGTEPTGPRPEPPPIPFVEAPRNADGRVLIGSSDDAPGLWVGRGGLTVTSHDEVPILPWAEQLVAHRRASPLEPHTRCKPSGGPRQWLTPYGAEMVEFPDEQRILIFDIGGPHTYRIIHTDGRPHPDDLMPSYYGHSVGHWEGDTLVIDSVGYNERFWMDRGRSPHSTDLHMIERLTRTSLHEMTYEITVEDPNVYTEPWTAELNMRWIEDEELFEFVCQDNNRATDIMIGTGDDVDRLWIVP